MEQSELGRVSNELNDRLTGQDVAGFDSVMAILSPFAKQVAMLVRETLQRLDNQSNSQVYRDGLSKVLQAPEFAGGENVRRVVQVMEEYSLLDQIAGELNNANDVRVVISGNGHMPQLRDISMVISRYGLNDHATGLLGVVGPLRMEYGRNISTVRFVAGLMSELVEDFYGA
jgi:heat-inducible transcriptional repressor